MGVRIGLSSKYIESRGQVTETLEEVRFRPEQLIPAKISVARYSKTLEEYTKFLEMLGLDGDMSKL
jgi:hypothetical protein